MILPSPLPDRPITQIHAHRRDAGAAAARLVHEEVVACVKKRGHCRIIFACAPSQDDYYAALVELARKAPDVWERVNAFHMDDYVGLTAAHEQSFRHYLAEHFLKHIKVASFEPLRGEAPDPAAEALRYGALLEAAPIDIISMGIGENGHIAFNDPPVADFNDKNSVKMVEMDQVCRQQQVNDGCFPTIADVPKHAFSITLPVFARAGLLACTVPTTRKAAAVRGTLLDPIGTACPATLLRCHPRAHLFLDAAAASLLPADVAKKFQV